MVSREEGNILYRDPERENSDYYITTGSYIGVIARDKELYQGLSTDYTLLVPTNLQFEEVLQQDTPLGKGGNKP